MPDFGHQPGKYHPHNIQRGPHGHRETRAVAVAQPARRRPERAGNDPLQREGQRYQPDLPAEAHGDEWHQRRKRHSERRRYQPHQRGDAYNHPCVMDVTPGKRKLGGPEIHGGHSAPPRMPQYATDVNAVSRKTAALLLPSAIMPGSSVSTAPGAPPHPVSDVPNVPAAIR